jgi:adenylate cyclase
MEENKNYSDKEIQEFINSLREGTIPKIENGKEFFEIIKKDSENYLDGKINRLEDLEYEERDPSEKFLIEYYKNVNKKNINVAILSVDIVGSTKLSKILPQEKYALLISLFLRELSQIITNYNGYPLKYIGDEIIAYFPGPNKKGMHNDALHCAYAIKKFVLKFLNPLLISRKFPEINFRLSLNSGMAMITVVGHPNSMQHFDLIGEPINLTKKIQSKAEINSIVVGQPAKEGAHKFWTTKTQELIDSEINGLKIYKLNIEV